MLLKKHETKTFTTNKKVWSNFTVQFPKLARFDKSIITEIELVELVMTSKLFNYIIDLIK